MHQVKLGSLAHSTALTPQADLSKKVMGRLMGLMGGEEKLVFFSLMRESCLQCHRMSLSWDLRNISGAIRDSRS